MSGQHTPEPWAVHPKFARIVPADHIGRPCGAHEDAAIDRDTYAQEICAMHWPDRSRSEVEVRANARRIVACVNACAGISTERLEKFLGAAANKSVITLTTDNIELKKQRDDLLAALEQSRCALALYAKTDKAPKVAIKLIDAAIASVKGGA